VSPDDQIRDVLPRLADGQAVAPGSYTVTVRKTGDLYGEARQWIVVVPPLPENTEVPALIY
jgi:hypothetical protein